MTFKMLYVNLKLSFIYLNPHIKTTNLPVLQNFTRGPCAQNEIFYFVVVTSQKPKRKKKKIEQKREEASFTPHGKNCTPSTQWCWKSTHAFFCLNTELEVRLQRLKIKILSPNQISSCTFWLLWKLPASTVTWSEQDVGLTWNLWP